MLARYSKENARRQVGELHAEALEGGVPPTTSVRRMQRVYEGYASNFDKGRAARDLAKYRFYSGDPEWMTSIEDSFELLRNARNDPDVPIAEELIIREEAATLGMSGRLTLLAGLEDANSGAFFVAADQLHNARLKFKKAPGRITHPDQYEINFAAAGAIADRYAHCPGRALLTLGRAALIAGMSETTPTRYRNTDLSKEERKAARKRSRSKAIFAAKIVFMTGGYRSAERETVRHKAFDILTGDPSIRALRSEAIRQRHAPDSSSRLSTPEYPTPAQ